MVGLVDRFTGPSATDQMGTACARDACVGYVRETETTRAVLYRDGMECM